MTRNEMASDVSVGDVLKIRTEYDLIIGKVECLDETTIKVTRIDTGKCKRINYDIILDFETEIVIINEQNSMVINNHIRNEEINKINTDKIKVNLKKTMNDKSSCMQSETICNKQKLNDFTQESNNVAEHKTKIQNKNKSSKTKEFDGKKAANEILSVLPAEIRDNFLTDHGTICKGEPEIIIYYANQNMQDYNRNISERKSLVKEYGELIGGNRSYLFDTHFDYDKIRKKLKVSMAEQILLYVDTSLFGNMKSGFVITDDGIYWSELLDGIYHIPFKKMNSIVNMNKSDDDYIIIMQHGSMLSSRVTASELNMKPLCELLTKLKVLSGFLK